jgi:hypothetical protein
VLQVSGTSALTYAAVNLAGGAGYVTGSLPAANQVAQTMTGDVTGNTGANTVTNITGSSGTATVTASTKLNFGTNPSTTGLINLPNNTFLYQRNAANSADLNMIGYNGSNALLVGDLTNANVTVSSNGTVNLTSNGNNVVLGSNAAGGQLQLAFGTGGVLIETGTVAWQFNQGTPLLTQASTSSGSAHNLTIQAGGATGSSHNGGNLILAGGTSGAATAGSVQVTSPLQLNNAGANPGSNIYSGTGAPSGFGVAGDFYFRLDGSTTTHIYFATGTNTWSGII